MIEYQLEVDVTYPDPDPNKDEFGSLNVTEGRVMSAVNEAVRKTLTDEGIDVGMISIRRIEEEEDGNSNN